MHAHIKLSSGHDRIPNTFINSEKVIKKQIKTAHI